MGRDTGTPEPLAWPEADNPTAACSWRRPAVCRWPAPRAARPAIRFLHRVTVPPPEDLPPARERVQLSRGRPQIRPDSSSAPTCASAMLNLMCGASKARVETTAVPHVRDCHCFGGAPRIPGNPRPMPTRSQRPRPQAGHPAQGFPMPGSPSPAGPSRTSTPSGRRQYMCVPRGGVMPARVVDEFFRPRRVAKRPERVAGPQERKLAGVHRRSTDRCLISASTASASSPRPSHEKCMRTNEVRFPVPPLGADCRFRQSIGKG